MRTERLVWLALTTAGLGCSDGLGPTERPDKLNVSPSFSVGGVSYRRRCYVGWDWANQRMVTILPTPGGNTTCPVQASGGPAGLFVSEQQPSGINITFSAPVYDLAVGASGTLTCAGIIGVLSASGPQGTLGQTFLSVIDPSDCGVDEATYGATASLYSSKSITSMAISAMTPLSWTFIYNNEVWTVHGDAEYSNNILVYLEAACAPVIDPATNQVEPFLDDARVRVGLVAQLDSSLTYYNSTRRRERWGWIVPSPNGGYEAQRAPLVLPDTLLECKAQVSEPPPADAVGQWHTHPSYTGQRYNDCDNSKGLPAPLQQGGGSEEDWNYAYNHPQLAVYTIARTGQINRLYPVEGKAWDNNNKRRWNFSRSHPDMCLTKK